MKTHIIRLLAFSITCSAGLDASFYPSGNPEVDMARVEVITDPTTPENYQQRALMLFVWLGIAQQQGADTFPFFDVDRAYYRLEGQVNDGPVDQRPEALLELCQVIDDGFVAMEGIFRQVIEKGPLFEPFTGTREGFPEGGDMEVDWPLFQGNIHNTGHTTAPGPVTGELAWKFPVGLGWYARPTVEGDRVYLGSPGMQTVCLCLDVYTGKEIWKSTQTHHRMGVYRYPAKASTPQIVGDQLILRDLGGHSGEERKVGYLNFLDKQTGQKIGSHEGGHVDYRTRVAPLAANDRYVTYPFGVHDITALPPVIQNFNRLVCYDRQEERNIWDFNVGDIDALAEPVMTEEMVFQGTMEGYLYALRLAEASTEELIAWKFRANGSINSAVTVHSGAVYFGSNGGTVYRLNEADGSLVWKTQVNPVESRARKHFSVPTIEGNVLYVGAANKCIYAMDTGNGEILWKVELSDWVRSRPVVTDEGLMVALINGDVVCLSRKGKIKWEKTISSHPIYADLVNSPGGVLINDSNLWLYCLGDGGEVIWKRSILNGYVNEDGERIFTDVLTGGTYYQSKPTAYQGKLYFGSPSGFLFSVDAETGEEIWKFEMGAALSVGPACADGKIYAGQQGGERFFYCLDADTGALVWKQTIPGGWVWGSATVDDGLVYVPTVSGYAVCLDGESGNIIWMYPTAKSIPAEPAIDGNLVYFGSWSRSLYAFDKKTGEIIWKENGIVLDSGTLVAKDGKIYVPDHRKIFMSFDGQTGEILSRGNTNEAEKGKFSNFNATPAAFEDRFYYAARVGVGLRGVPMASRVYCVDAETAGVLWTFPDGGGLSAPAIASGRLYIASGNSPFFYCLDAFTGKPHWIHKLGHHVEESTLCIYRDRIYALAADGFVHAIQ